MELSVAYAYGTSLLTKHGLTQEGWKLNFDRGKTRAGLCNYNTKTITLSKHLVLNTDVESIENTMLHEIAHALVGASHGHDAVWQQKAIDIGCDGKRCHDMALVEPAWKVFCPCGTNNITRHNLKRMYFSVKVCANCKQPFSAQHIKSGRVMQL